MTKEAKTGLRILSVTLLILVGCFALSYCTGYNSGKWNERNQWRAELLKANLAEFDKYTGEFRLKKSGEVFYDFGKNTPEWRYSIPGWKNIPSITIPSSPSPYPSPTPKTRQIKA